MNNDKSNIDSLRRIFELEHIIYKLNTQISALKEKLEKKEVDVINLRTEKKKLQNEVKKMDQLTDQKEQTTLSVGFLIITFFYSAYLH